MLINYLEYYFSITFPYAQKKNGQKTLFLGAYSGVTP